MGLIINEKMSFENVDLTKVYFLDTDLRKIDFINCTWHKKHGRGRNRLYDEIMLFEKRKIR